MKKFTISAGAVVLGALAYQWLKPRRTFATQVAVITGGSRGLGLALARRLGRELADLALISRDEEELAKAKEELDGYGTMVTTWPCDLQNERELSATFEKIGKRFGLIDLLINNAGEIMVGPFDAMSRKDFETALAVHFWAPLNATLAAIPYLQRAASPRIINIVSVGGRVAVPHMAPYCASKFALAGLSDALRAELAMKRISVTTVSPGLMRTGSHKNALFKGAHKKEFGWFSLGAATPLFSMDADRAARQIVRAAWKNQPALTISMAARALILAQALAPNCLARMMKLVARFLPTMPPEGGTEVRTGWESQSGISPSVLTAPADNATERFNEKR